MTHETPPQPEPLPTFARTGVLTHHDLGCRCWPHVSERDALDAIAAVGLAEYRDGVAARLPVSGESEGLREDGECLMCGHRMLLAIWSPRDPNVGVCFACRQAAEPLRGPCSHARGCLCPCPYPFHEDDHCIGCHGHNRAWGAGWDPRTNEWDHEHDHADEIANEALRVGRMEVAHVSALTRSSEARTEPEAEGE